LVERHPISVVKVLVTFAVDAEFAPWRELRHFEKLNRDGIETYAGKIEGAEVTVLLTGIGGKKMGWEANGRVWSGIDVCISSGLAGALREEYRVGDILAARRIERGSGATAVVCDEALLHVASELKAKIVSSFYSANQIIGSAMEKQELGKLADAVEMESDEILRQAAAAGARIIAVRAISDASNEDLPLDFSRTTTDFGEVSIRKVLSQVVRRPQSIPALIRFGKQSKNAAEKLARFLDGYVKRVAQAREVLISKEVSGQ
jgi:nucleoside phosphorylase